MFTARQITRHTMTAFGVAPSVEPKILLSPGGEEGLPSLNLIECDNIPQFGVTSYATIGMSQYTNLSTGGGKNLGVELLAAAGSNWKVIQSGLIGSALNIASGKHSIWPDTIFPDVMSGFDQAVSVPHALFVLPFLWNDIEDLESDDLVITWLMMVPVSDQEFLFAELNGVQALNARLLEAQPDVFNLMRPSVI